MALEVDECYQDRKPTPLSHIGSGHYCTMDVTTGRLGTAALTGADDPGFVCHECLRSTAALPLARAQSQGTARPVTSADDLLRLVGGIGSAAADRADSEHRIGCSGSFSTAFSRDSASRRANQRSVAPDTIDERHPAG